MATIIAGDIIRVSSVWKYNATDDQVNVLHLKVGADMAASDNDILDDILEYVHDAYLNVQSFFSTLVTHDHFEIVDVTRALHFGTFGADSALDGGQTGDALPPQVTGLVIFPTTSSRIQGRVYLPTFGEAQNASGAWVSGVMTGMTDFGIALTAPVTEGNGTRVQYVVREHGGSGIIPRSYRVIPNPRIQRRRQVGRGS